MEILIAPASGGYFPNQLAACNVLCLLDYKPLVVFAASGGAITTLMLECMEWCPNNFREIVSEINSTRFVKAPMVPYLGVGWSALHGSMYNFSELMVPYIVDRLKRRKVSKLLEVWMSMNDTEFYMPQLMCTLEQADCLMNLHPLEQVMFNAKSVKYANGDYTSIANGVQACSAVPGLLPKKVIDGEKYSDGALSYTSPLVFFKKELVETATERAQPLHFTMLAEVDLNKSCPIRYVTLKPELIKSLYGTFKAGFFTNMLNERVACIDMQNSLGLSCVGMLTSKTSAQLISKLLAYKKDSVGTLVELYSDCDSMVDLNSFTGDQLLRMVDEAGRSMQLRFWWFQSKEMLHSTDNIVNKDLQWLIDNCDTVQYFD